MNQIITGNPHFKKLFINKIIEKMWLFVENNSFLYEKITLKMNKISITNIR